MIGPSLIVFDRFKSLSHPLKEEAVQWQTGFMATPRCFTYRLNLKRELVAVNVKCLRDGNILVTQIQRMGTLLDLVNLTKNSDKCVSQSSTCILHLLAITLTRQVHHWANCHLLDCRAAWSDRTDPRHADCPCWHQAWQLPSLPHPLLLKVSLNAHHYLLDLCIYCSFSPGQSLACSWSTLGRQSTLLWRTPRVNLNLQISARFLHKMELIEQWCYIPSFSRFIFHLYQGKYHLDYFGIAGSAYCLLFGKYIEVNASNIIYAHVLYLDYWLDYG